MNTRHIEMVTNRTRNADISGKIIHVLSRLMSLRASDIFIIHYLVSDPDINTSPS